MALSSASYLLALVLAMTALLRPTIAREVGSADTLEFSTLEHRELVQVKYKPPVCNKIPAPGNNLFEAQEVTDEMRQCFVEQIEIEIRAIDAERNQAGFLHSVTADFLREVFHDCGPGHCDGSLLLNAKELAHPSNTNIDGPENIARVMKRVQGNCPPYNISWADALVLSTVVGIQLVGGPDMRLDIPLGRGDSDQCDNVALLPAPTMSARSLYTAFRAIFPQEKDKTVTLLLVTLSGAHTLGDCACGAFEKRRKDGLPTVDKKFQKQIQNLCKKDVCNKAAFDQYTENEFDNKYYKSLLEKKGLLFSDQTLVSAGDCSSGVCTAKVVKAYAKDQDLFFDNFKWAFCALATLGTDLTCPYDWTPIY